MPYGASRKSAGFCKKDVSKTFLFFLRKVTLKSQKNTNTKTLEDNYVETNLENT